MEEGYGLGVYRKWLSEMLGKSLKLCLTFVPEGRNVLPLT